jgi:hypothetical protein
MQQVQESATGDVGGARANEISRPVGNLTQSSKRRNNFLLIGITLAIAVPPAILLGAIIGFLVAQTQGQ